MKPAIAALNDVHLLLEAQTQIQTYASNTIDFTGKSAVPATAIAALASPGMQLDRDFFETHTSIKYVGICGTSLANVDLTAAKKHGVTVTNVTDYGDEPTAEFIFMQLLMAARGIGQYQWRPDPCELMGKSLGIVGAGALGKTIANLGLGFKMHVRYHGPHRKPELESKGVVYRDLHELLATSDIVCVSSPTNVEVLQQAEFAQIRPGTILVQATSGHALNRKAFLAWLHKGESLAIFDYSAGEDNFVAYAELPNVIFPKIIAGHSIETRQRLGEKVAWNLEKWLREEFKP